jgi:glutamate 5-kinase
VLQKGGKSLLPVGVVAVVGGFRRGDMVSCEDEHGVEVARGLVNYDAVDVQRIKRLASDRILSVLGYCHESELIHRDNMVLIS